MTGRIRLNVTKATGERRPVAKRAEPPRTAPRAPAATADPDHARAAARKAATRRLLAGQGLTVTSATVAQVDRAWARAGRELR